MNILFDNNFSLLNENLDQIIIEKNNNQLLESLNESSVLKTKEIIDTRKFDLLEKLIKSSKKILIVRHIAPDADAIFSARALEKCIKERYQDKIVTVAGDGIGLKLDSETLLIVLDTPIRERFSSKVVGNPREVRIDHHPNGFIAGDLTIEEKESGSTCEIITLFLDYEKYKIDKETAEGLFKGIISDTGRMQYSLSKTTLLATNILVSLGINYKKIYNSMYTKGEDELKSKAYILNNYTKTPNGVAYIFLDPERSMSAGIDAEKTSRQVYEMSEIKGYPIWVFITEKKDGTLTARVRSRVIPINKIVERFGGGGHENAAGVKLKDRETARNLIRTLDKELGSYKKTYGKIN